MTARERLKQIKERFDGHVRRADLPSDSRLFVFVEPAVIREAIDCGYPTTVVVTKPNASTGIITIETQDSGPNGYRWWGVTIAWFVVG